MSHKGMPHVPCVHGSGFDPVQSFFYLGLLFANERGLTWRQYRCSVIAHGGGGALGGNPAGRLLVMRCTASTVARNPSTRPLHTPTCTHACSN